LAEWNSAGKREGKDEIKIERKGIRKKHTHGKGTETTLAKEKGKGEEATTVEVNAGSQHNGLLNLAKKKRNSSNFTKKSDLRGERQKRHRVTSTLGMLKEDINIKTGWMMGCGSSE